MADQYTTTVVGFFWFWLKVTFSQKIEMFLVFFANIVELGYDNEHHNFCFLKLLKDFNLEDLGCTKPKINLYFCLLKPWYFVITKFHCTFKIQI